MLNMCYLNRSSRGVDTIVFMERGTVLEVVHESNGPGPIGDGAGVGSCIYDTSFHYGQLNVFLILPAEDEVTTTTTTTTTTTAAPGR